MENLVENTKIAEAYKKMVNRQKAIELSEASLSHIIGKKHDGYFIISACRGNNNDDNWVTHELFDKLGGTDSKEFKSLSKDEQHKYLDNNYWNNIKTKELMRDLHDLGYGFVPTYGGFKEKSPSNSEGTDVFEKSFFVPFQLKDADNKEGFEKMKSDIIALGKKYRQESVAICPPNEAPYFYVTYQYGNGDPVGSEQRYFGRDYNINDVAKEYFTSLNKVDRFDRGKDKANPHRFSFCESVTVDNSPTTYMGAYSRFSSGEIFASNYPSAKMAIV